MNKLVETKKSELVNHCPRPKCKDCKLECKWRRYFIELDNDSVCPIYGDKERVMFAESSPITKDNLEFYSAMIVSQIRKMCTNEPKELAYLHKCIIEHKKNFYPDQEVEGAKKDVATALVDKIFSNMVENEKDTK